MPVRSPSAQWLGGACPAQTSPRAVLQGPCHPPPQHPPPQRHSLSSVPSPTRGVHFVLQAPCHPPPQNPPPRLHSYSPPPRWHSSPRRHSYSSPPPPPASGVSGSQRLPWYEDRAPSHSLVSG